MTAHDTPPWEATIRPWRILSAAIAAAEVVAIVAAFALVLSDTTAAFVCCAILLLVDLVKWLVERHGLRQVPEVEVGELYAAAPLEPAHRALVVFNLAAVPILVVLLLLISPAAALVGLLTAASTCPPLVRVWRRNSWLAISRLPSRPRRRAAAS